MGAFAWIMMGLAVWHFTIFLPDRFWGGIVGAFLGAVIGAFVFGLIIHGFAVPRKSVRPLTTTAFAVPGKGRTHLIPPVAAFRGTLAGIAAASLEAARRGIEPLHL